MEKARRKAIEKRANELDSLLAEFDIQLSGFDPGVMGYIKSKVKDGVYSTSDTINVDASTWNWLKPILEELRDKRKNGA
jgi:hypothetical protein